VSRGQAKILRKVARTKEKEARKFLRSRDPVDKAVGRELLTQVRNLRTRADIMDAQG
jgi:hypothetical protein